MDSAIDGDVRDVVEGPDGKLYATGCFNDAGGVAEADKIAVWDGTNWAALGNNGSGEGFFYDGCGYSIAWASNGDLILGGSIRDWNDSNDQSLFMWDGATWTNLAQDQLSGGDGIRDVEVDSLGNIYFGGPFSNANGDGSINNFAKLSGGIISALGTDGFDGQAINGHVMTIEIDSLDNVYIGGKFQDAGGIAAADAVAKWDGTSWSALDSDGVGGGYFANDSSYDVINDIILVGSTLYVASSRWDTPATYGSDGYGVYAYDGTDFAPLFDVTLLNNTPWSLDYNVDDNVLLIAGRFEDFNGDAYADGLIGWDLDTSTHLAYGSNGSDGADRYGNGFSVGYLGAGNIAYGGQFNDLAGESTADHLSLWDSQADSWQSLGSTPDGAFDGRVYDTAVGPDGNLYATGCFHNASTDPTADIVAMWDGDSWVGLGNNGFGNGFFAAGSGGCGFALDWTSTGDLVLGGRELLSDGEEPYQSLYSWDGESWVNLAPDMLSNSNGIRDIHVNGDDSIYIAGPLANMDGNTNIDFIALWDNGTISAVGDDGEGGRALNNHALNLEVDDSGNLYVAGKFENAGGVAEADYIAMWDGTSWTALGSPEAGLGYFGDADNNSHIHAMEWINGTLYVGANRIDTPDYSDIRGVFAFANGEFTPVIDSTQINLDDDIRDFAYDNESNRLLVAGEFENLNDDPLADGLVGIDLDDGVINTYGGRVFSDDIEPDGADRYAGGNSVAFLGDGDIIYSGDFENFNDDEFADGFAFWNGPAAGLSATGVDGSSIGYLAVAAAIAVAGGLTLRRRA